MLTGKRNPLTHEAEPPTLRPQGKARRYAKGYCRTCHGPKQADHCAGDKIANTIESGQHAEGHAVVSLINEFRAQRIFQRLLDAYINTTKDKHSA
jgi:hypothetical protein